MKHIPCPRCGGCHTQSLTGPAHRCCTCMRTFGFTDSQQANAAADAVQELHFFLGGHNGPSFRLLLTASGHHEVESWDSRDCTPTPTFTHTPTRFKRLVRRLLRHYYVMDWNPEYHNEDILDGTQWELSIILQNHQKRQYCGSNAYPPRFHQLLRLIAPYFLGKGIRFP